MNRDTGRTWMMSFIGKRLLKRNKHKEKISSSSSRMLRTISIHHLECIDYVPQSEVGQIATGIECSNVTLGCNSSAISEHELLVFKDTQESANGNMTDDFPGSHHELDKIENHSLAENLDLKGKLLEAREALLKQKDANLMVMANQFAIQSKHFLDTLVLFNANRETLLDNLKDPNYISPDYVEILQSATGARMLIKSASCPEFLVSSGILFPTHKKMESDFLVNQRTKSESTSPFISIAGISSDSKGLDSSHELRKRREAGIVVNQSRNLKQRINDVILKNRKEKHRISRDGILHRVPFGHKLPEDKEDKKLNLGGDPTSGRCDEGGEGNKFNNVPYGSYRKCAHKSFQRSRSVSESLDRYSQLFETLSLNEMREVPERSTSNREDSGLGKFSKNLGKMLSSPALRSFSFSKDVQSDVYLKSSKNLSPKPLGSEREKIVRSKSIQEDSDLPQGILPMNFGRMLSSPEFRSYSLSEVLEGAGYLELTKTPQEHLGSEIERTIDELTTDAFISPILEKNDCEHEAGLEPVIPFRVEEATSSDKFVMPSVTDMVESKVIPVSVDVCKHLMPYLVTEVMEEETDLVSRLKTQEKAESDVKSGKPSFISSLNLNMVEGSTSSAKEVLPKELQSICIDSDEQHQLFNEDINCNEHYFAKHSKPGYNDENFAKDACDASTFHVEHKDDTVFEFVRCMLAKSCYGVLHRKTEFPSYELRAELYGTPLEKQLLFDLINDVLLEIYENSTAPNPWLLRFHSKIRSKPKGNYLLKDVWAEISWHLHSPQGLDVTLDDLMAHAFARNDGWLNLYRDTEFAALQLEHLILDDLLDEAVINSDGFDF